MVLLALTTQYCSVEIWGPESETGHKTSPKLIRQCLVWNFTMEMRNWGDEKELELSEYLFSNSFIFLVHCLAGHENTQLYMWMQRRQKNPVQPLSEARWVFLLFLQQPSPFTNTDTFVSISLPSAQAVKTSFQAVVLGTFCASTHIPLLCASLPLPPSTFMSGT